MGLLDRLFSRGARRPSDQDAGTDPPAAAAGDPDRAKEPLLRALRLALGEGTEPDETQALATMRRAAELGSPDAEFLAGVMILYGIGCEPDPDEAVERFRAASDQGQLDALYELGVCLEAGGRTAADRITGIYRRGAEAGHLACINGLRSRCHPERGVAPDPGEYVRWTARAAEIGDAEAQYELGVLYASGEGVERSPNRAVEWYRRAADQDFDLACHNLGACHATGQGVGKDLAAAAEWYRKAAELGSPKSCETLAAMYYHGEGVPQDREAASRWLERADALAREKESPSPAESMGRLRERMRQGAARHLREALDRHAGRAAADSREPPSAVRSSPAGAPARSGGGSSSRTGSLELLIGFSSDQTGFTLTAGDRNHHLTVKKPSPTHLAGRGIRLVFEDVTLKADVGQGDVAALLHVCMTLQDRLATAVDDAESLQLAVRLATESLRELAEFGPGVRAKAQPVSVSVS